MGSEFDRLHEPITAMLTTNPGLSIQQIWERLIDNHNAEISCARVRDYVAHLRPGIGAPESNGPDQPGR